MPWQTPPYLLLAALFGGVTAWRAGRKGLVLLLVGWVLAFLMAHSVVGTHAYGQARYHLHVVVPFVLLSALGLEALFARRMWLGWLALGCVALSPLLYTGFIRATFNDQHEHAFTRELARRLPPGCTVVEFAGLEEPVHASRFERVGALLSGGRVTSRFRVWSLTQRQLQEDGLPEEVVRSRDDPAACLAWFEGLACWRERKSAGSIAAACQRLRDELRLPEAFVRRFSNRPDDGNMRVPFDDEHREEIVLRLFGKGIEPAD